MDEIYSTILAQTRTSNTQARKIVFKALARSSTAVSMNELITLCEKIDRVSVYRTIEIFEKIGVVQRVQIGWKYKIELGDAFKSHHHHMTCNRCGLVIEFDEPNSLDDELRELNKKYGFATTQHTLELRGICRACQKIQE